MATPTPRRSHLVVAVIALATITGVGIFGTIRQAQRRPVADAIAIARRAAVELFDSIERMPGAAPTGPRTETVYRRRSIGVALEQEYEAPGPFADAVASYGRALEPSGWKLFDPKEPRHLKVDWCKPPWMLTLTRAASFDDPPIRHRHAVRLEWSRGFTPDRCPFPD